MQGGCIIPRLLLLDELEALRVTTTTATLVLSCFRWMADDR